MSLMGHRNAVRELEPSLGRFAFLTRWHSLHLPFRSCTGPFISPDSNHSSRNSTFSKQHFSPRDDQHGEKPSCPLADRQGGATLARFGGLQFQPNDWTQLDQGTREGGREGRGGEGREGRGEGRGGQGRGGDCPHFPQTRTFVTAEPSRTPAKRVTG